MCPLGIGKLGQEGSCRFHKSVKDLLGNDKCPIHNLELELATLPEDQMTMTVMGEEDIEPEIEDRNENKHRAKQLSEVDDTIEAIDVGGEFATVTKKEIVKNKRIADVENKISQKKKDGFFLVNEKQISDYRTKRKEDIRLAIIESKKYEDK